MIGESARMLINQWTIAAVLSRRTLCRCMYDTGRPAFLDEKGRKVLRGNRTTRLQDHATTGPRDYGTTRLRDHATTGPRDYGTTRLRDHATTGPRDYGATDYGATDYGTTDYGTTDYRTTDYRTRG